MFRDQVDPELLNTFEKLGIPLTEQKAGIGSLLHVPARVLLSSAPARLVPVSEANIEQFGFLTSP